VSDEGRDSCHRDGRRHNSRPHDEGGVAGTDSPVPAHHTESRGRYGPFESPAEDSSAVVYEEFSCEDALLATVFDTERSDRWIQTTLVVPVEE
jgi:hypothetical protein